MQSIKVIPTGKLLDGQPTETDVIITLDDGTSQTFPVVFPKDMFTVIRKSPDLSDYVKNEVLNTIVAQIHNQITNNNTQIQNQISNLPKPPDISPLATKDALNNEITARSNAINNVTDQLNSVESTQKTHGDSISQVESGLSNETTRAQKAESDLKSEIDNLDNTYVSGQADTGGTAIRELNFASDGAISVKDANGNITKVAKLDDLNSVSTNVEGQISNILNNTIAQSENKLNSRIDQLATDIINGNNQLTQTTQALITNGIQNKNDVADLGVVVQKEISDRQAGEKTLSDKIDTTKSDIETDLSNQKTQVETDISNAVTGVNKTISDNNAARIADNQATNKTLYQEIGDRQSGDTALGKRIDQEVSDREAGDKTNSDAITQEISDRKADTASLTTQIQNEATTRSQNDTTISNNLSQEVKDREAADTALTNNLNQEIQRAESAETSITESVTALSNKSITGTPNSSNVSVKSVTLNSPSDLVITDSSGTTTQVITKANLDEEAQTRSTNDQTLQKNIDAETAAREQADQSLNTQMGNIASQLQGAVNTEQSARVAADNALQSKIDSNNTTTQTAISDEAKARSDADTALGNQITQEVSDRKSAITDLQNTLNDTINQEASASAAANTTLSYMISTETGNREQADQNLQSALGAETRSRQTADSALQKNIDSTNASLTSETNRAEAAEKTLQSNIDSETSARTIADQSLQTSISNETSRAESVEQTLQNAVSSLNKNTVSNVPDQGGMASESLSFDSGGNVIIKDTSNNKTRLAKYSDVDHEIDNRITGDMANTDAIAKETQRRAAADNVLQTNINNETARAQSAEQANATAIGSIKTSYLALATTTPQTLTGSQTLTINYKGVTFNTSIPTITTALPDTPGNSSNNIPTTAWVDKYYISRTAALNIKYIGIDNTLNNTSVGNDTVVTNNGNTTIGSGSKATGTNCTSIGLNAFSTGYSSTALGNTVSSTGKYSVAIGAFSSTAEDNVVSVGAGLTNSADPNAPLFRRITNVADGKNPNDAVNIEQLNAAAMNAASPVGTIMAFAGSGKIANYLLCDGGTFDPVAYPDLYKLLGTTNVPDLRGMFLRGLDTTGNIDNVAGGRKLLSFEDGSYIQGDRVGYTRSLNRIASVAGKVNWSDSSQTHLSSMAALGWDVPINPGPPFPPTSYGGYSQEYNTGTTFDESGNIIYKTSSQVNGITRPKNVAVNYYIRALPPTSGTIATDGSGGSSTGNSATKDWVESYFTSVTDFNNLKSQLVAGTTGGSSSLPLTSTTNQTVTGSSTSMLAFKGYESIEISSPTNFDTAPTISTAPTDKPGNTSNSVPTTSWVDENYLSKDTVLHTGNPVGTIVAYSGLATPDSYLECDGGTFDPVVYPDLYKLLGKNTTPDLRGMFLRGLDTSYSHDMWNGSTSPRAILSFEEGSYVTKDPNGSVGNFYGGGDNSTGMLKYTNWDPQENPSANTRMFVWTAADVTISNWDTGYGPYQIGVTRPKNVAVNYIIKAKPSANGSEGDYLPLNMDKDYNITTNGHTLTVDNLVVTNSLTSASELVGPPIPWPTITPPAGYLAMDGGSFDTTKYPKLATVYPSGKLPDLRGMFIRGYDPTNNVDPHGSSRGIVSTEPGTNTYTPALGRGWPFSSTEPTGWGDGNVDYAPANSTPTGSIYPLILASGDTYNVNPYTSSNKQEASSWGSSRPTNVNFYYIVKAG